MNRFFMRRVFNFSRALTQSGDGVSARLGERGQAIEKGACLRSFHVSRAEQAPMCHVEGRRGYGAAPVLFFRRRRGSSEASLKGNGRLKLNAAGRLLRRWWVSGGPNVNGVWAVVLVLGFGLFGSGIAVVGIVVVSLLERLVAQ